MSIATPTIPLRIEHFQPPQRSGVGELLFRATIEHLHAQQMEALRWIAQHPEAPDEVLLLLCEHADCRELLAHRANLSTTILELLADAHGVDEAILSLGKAKYSHDEVSLGELETFLERHADRLWLLESLVRVGVASSREKRAALREKCARHSDSQRLLKLIEQGELAEKAGCETDPDLLRQLFDTGDAAVWRALSLNRAVPREILEKLAEVTEIQGAREIRRNALNALARGSS